MIPANDAEWICVRSKATAPGANQDLAVLPLKAFILSSGFYFLTLLSLHDPPQRLSVSTANTQLTASNSPKMVNTHP